MKNIKTMTTLKFFITFLICTSAISQNIEDQANYLAIYELEHQPDSTNVDSKKKESMRLYIGDHISMFASSGTVVKDSLLANTDRSNKSMAALTKIQSEAPDTDFTYWIFKNSKSGDIKLYDKIVKNTYHYEEVEPLMEWNIEPGTKEIAGYDVQKATTTFRGRNYTAWFTPEIPISNGPYKFSGLPGLIIDIVDVNNEYSFKLKSFKKLNQSRSIEVPSEKSIELSREKLTELWDNYHRDPFSSLEQSGITFGFEAGVKEELMKNHREERKLINNPLELE